MRHFKAVAPVKALTGALVLMAALAVVGCGTQSGRTIITQGATSDPVMGTAPQAGEYMLFTAASPNPTTTVRLNEGEPLGFRRGDDGHLIGVAGNQTSDLPKGTAQAYWKLQTK